MTHYIPPWGLKFKAPENCKQSNYIMNIIDVTAGFSWEYSWTLVKLSLMHKNV